MSYMDFMVNSMAIMYLPKAEPARFKMKEALRCVVPQGIIASFDDGTVA